MSIFVGIEKLSLVDFDQKLSCTLFTNGCNFKCPFCHNSPLINTNNNLLDWQSIKDYLISRKNLLDAVVITGGEPTLHKNLKQYLKEIKDIGYLIKLDTNGSNPDILKELIKEQLIDYIAMDIKSSFNNYREVIDNKNIDLNLIKESIDIIKTSNLKYEFRTTLVKEYHNEEQINEIKNLLKGTNRLYLQKFILRDTCINQNLHEVSLEDAKNYQNILSETIKKVELRGY